MKYLFLILFFWSYVSNADIYDLHFDTQYSYQTTEYIHNIKFRKFDKTILDYLFVDREFRINIYYNPFAESECGEDGILVKYFNFSASWNF